MVTDGLFISHDNLEDIDIIVDDIIRRPFWSHKRAGRTIPLVVIAQFTQGRDILQIVQPFFRVNAEHAKHWGSPANQRFNVANLGTGKVHFALAQGKELIGRAAVRNGIVFEFSRLCKELGSRVIGCLYPVGGSFEFSGVLLGVCHKILQRLPLAVRTDDNNTRFLQMIGNGHDTLLIEGGSFLQGQGRIGR